MKIYNTLSRKKETFIPLEEGKVKIYSCGPTVYNYFHLGNARPFITFDTLRRYLEYRGYEVTFVQNFTDIDDKVIQRALLEGKSTKEIANRYIEEYFYDADKLNIRRASFQPRATDSMDKIIDMIGKLLEKGHAYVADDGVYYSTRSFEDYGKLSGYNLEDLEEGAGNRALNGDNKRDASDFALWKFKKDGEPAWDSPWGEGRPGWHIECSAMVNEFLGETIDIHGGGQDLVFPHHENEIAQSEACSGHALANYWMHNGFINVNNEKMAKSRGNFFTVRDIAKEYPHHIIRFFILSGHYRSPINFSDDLLKAAQSGFERIENCVLNLRFLLDSGVDGEESEISKSLVKATQDARTDFCEAMDDDLNTADAFAVIYDFIREANTATASDVELPRTVIQGALDLLLELLDVLGLKIEEEDKIPESIMKLVEERAEAKAARNFALADELRDQVQKAGYSIEDTAQGPRVYRN